MKKILSILTVVLLAAVAGHSQAPGFFNYQGVARNSVGNVVKNQLINLRLTIVDGSAAGPVVYQESRQTTTNPFGLFNVQVGSAGASNVTGTIAGVNWGVSAKFIRVEADLTGGTSFVNIGTAPLASVPYSLFSTLSGDLVLPFNKTQSDAGTLFKVTNSANGAGSTAIEGLTNSTAGNATAILGTVTSSSPGGFSTAVKGVNNGTGGLGIGVWGGQGGSGWGVYGTSPSGIGVNGSANSGIGVNGSSSSGIGGRFTTTSGQALFTTGAIRLQGLGETNNFVLRSDASGNATWVDPAVLLPGANFWSRVGTNLFPTNAGDNVGFGTSTPGAKTHILHAGGVGMINQSTAGFSTIDINAFTGDAALRFQRAGTNQWNVRNNPGNDDLQFFEMGGGGERMAIKDGTGNVAIGGSTGAYRLDILHGGSTGILNKSSAGFSVLDIDAFTGDAAIRFANNGVNQWNVRNQPGTDNLQIFELGGGGERMHIQNSTGNVSIGGEPSPSYRLDILHGGSTGIRNRSTGSFSVFDIDAFSGDAAIRFANNGVNQWNIRNQPGTDNLQIFELGGGGERMHIQNSTGNVSIGGEASPSYRLDILHGGSTGERIRSSASFSVLDIDAFSGDAAIRFANNGVNQWNIRNQPGTDNLQIFELGGGGERMHIQNGTGNVAIGGSSGAYRLDILHGGSTGILNKSSAGFSVLDIDAFTGDAAIRLANNGVNQWNIRNQPGTDNLQIFELGGGGERMRIDNGTGLVVISGGLTVLGLPKMFTMDHPLDPENKTLRHAAAESNEVINFYSGKVVTDANGKATVQLPDYFDAINTDPRYQLTVIGSFAQAIISKEESNNQFEIATNQPNVKVSWEVKAVRSDRRMKIAQFKDVIEKTPAQKGKYWDPAAYNLPESRNISYDPTAESSLNYVPKADKKAAPATTGGSLDYTAPATPAAKSVDKSGSVEDVPAAKTDAKPAPATKGGSLDDMPKPKVEEKKTTTGPDSTKTE
jgi:hypothetical protein